MPARARKAAQPKPAEAKPEEQKPEVNQDEMQDWPTEAEVDAAYDEIAKQEAEEPKADPAKPEKYSSPNRYANSRGIAPQRVYAAFRSGKLKRETCEICTWHSIVDVEAADKLFGFNQPEQTEEPKAE